jgi:3-oxoacyl-[acyl-carrier-protein] synthase II
LLADLLGSGGRDGLAILSGASGVEPVTGEELALLTEPACGNPIVRAYGSALGHGVEAHFPTGVALAALALSRNAFYPPFDTTGVEIAEPTRPDRVLVSGFGHWRGEGMALLERIA